MKRRDFVRTGVGAGSLLYVPGLLSLSTLGCKPRAEIDGGGESELSEGPVNGVRTRMSVLDPNNTVFQQKSDPVSKALVDDKTKPKIHMVDVYRNAVAAMKATRVTVGGKARTAWEHYANIHQDFCPHGNWYFLPWHRAYLLSFEEACRRFSQNNNFMLPYWPWDQSPKIPAMFMTPKFGQTSNSLFESSRLATTDSTMSSEYVGKAAISQILGTNDFYAFASGPSIRTRPLRGEPRGGGGILESMPHNETHMFVDGVMGTFLSPTDPIFWLHHCNVDRMWALWELKLTKAGRPTLPANPIKDRGVAIPGLTKEVFLNYTLEKFHKFDPKLALTDSKSWLPMTMKVSDTVAIGRGPVNYDYTDARLVVTRAVAASSPQTAARSLELPDVAQSNSLKLSLNKPVVATKAPTKRLDFDIKRTDELNSVLSSVGKNLNTRTTKDDITVRMLADNVPVPQDPKAKLRFFVNLAGDPSSTNPAYVGTYSKFTHGDHAGHQGASTTSLIFDLTTALKAIRKFNKAFFTDGKIPLVVTVAVQSSFDLPQQSVLDAVTLSIEYVEPKQLEAAVAEPATGATRE
jgi:hypothetical protein